MAENKRYTFRKILVASVWILLGAGMIVLLVAAITKKNSEPIAGVEITIDGVRNHYFIDKKEVVKILESINGSKLEKAAVSSLNLMAMENALQKSQWIKKVEMFFDNNNVLQVKITEREPIARIFTTSGASFYMDSTLMRLPLSDKFSARLPVFTNFPTDVRVLTKQDSLLFGEIKLLGGYIGNHPFWMAQIEQIDITPLRTFELIPKLGGQVIRFGDTENYKEKFNKLLAFYKQVQTKTGWNRYSVLDLQYKGQVVGVNRNLQEIKADMLQAVQIMKNIIAEAKEKINDSTSIQLPQQEENNSTINHSRVIEDALSENAVQKEIPENRIEVSAVTPIHDPEKPVLEGRSTLKANPVVNKKPATGAVKKAVVKKTPVKKEAPKNPGEKIIEQPKAVMPPKSDY